MMEMVLDEANIRRAIDELLKGKNTCGVDGVYASGFEDYWKLNGKEIVAAVREGRYHPDSVRETEILKKNGGKRLISCYTCTDRVILRAIKNVIEPLWEGKFSEKSFAYQKGKGVVAAVNQAAEYIREGYRWVLELDIEDFFDAINLEQLFEKICGSISDEYLTALIKKYLYCTIQCDYNIRNRVRGIVQGNPLSPLFSNIYMDSFDRYMEERYHFCRFSDDVNVYFKDKESAFEAWKDIESYLKVNLGLSLKRSKCGVYPAINRDFLGYEFYKRQKDICVRKKMRGQDVCYSRWHATAIQKINRDYHIINDGILSKRDYTLLFENKDKKYYIPVETCGALNVYSNTSFSSGFFELAAKKKLAVNIYDRFGRHVGSFVSGEHYLSVKTMLKQAEVYLNMGERVKYAKKIEIASLHNVRENLRYYYKHKKSKHMEAAIGKITEAIRQINEAATTEDIMLAEARARQQYYSCFDEISGKAEFAFENRSRRPPRNPINAMISFGNVVLYQKIATEIYKTSLDIRIGLVHSANGRSESLNLDIAEIFKPIIVDRVIFALINNKAIKADLHFTVLENGGVMMNLEGKRIFIRELEKKLFQKITVKGDTVTYQTLMKDEVWKIFKSIYYGQKYTPYKYY